MNDLFQVTECFSLDADKENTTTQYPLLCSIQKRGDERVFSVAQGSSIQLFTESSECVQVLLRSPVAVSCWNHRGTCVVLGDSTGSIHFVNSEGVVLFSYPLLQPKQEFKFMKFAANATDLLGDDPIDNDELIIVTSNPDRIIRVGKLSISLIEDAVQAKNLSLLKNIRDTAKIQVHDLHQPSAIVKLNCNVSTGMIRVLLASKDTISVWQCTRKSPTLDLIKCSTGGNHKDLVMIETVGIDDDILVGLTGEGDVKLWDVHQLLYLCTIMKCEDGYHCVGFAPLEAKNQMAFLLRSDLKDVSKLLIARIHLRKPFEILFSKEKIASGSRFVSVPWDATSVFLISNSSQVIGFECSQSNEFSRFDNCIENEKYDQALEIIEKFHLDDTYKEKLHKFRLSSILATILKEPGSLSRDVLREAASSLSQLIASNPIQYMKPVIQRCISLYVNCIENQKYFVGFAQEELVKHKSSIPANLFSEIECLLADCSRRLKTFEMVLMPFDGQKWQAFRQCDISMQVCKGLQEGSLAMSSCVWRRHGSGDSVSMLKYIHHGLPVGVYLRWITDQIASRAMSDIQKAQLAEWTCEYVENVMADIAGKYDERLALVNEVSLLCSNVNSKDRYSEREKIQLCFASPLQIVKLANSCSTDKQCNLRLGNLRRDMLELQFLHTYHQLPITLEILRLKSREQVTWMLLASVTAPQLIASRISTHIVPCAKRYGLNAFQVLENFVDDGRHLLEGRGSAREQCLVEITRCISDRSRAARAVLSLMQTIMPPFSSEFTALVEDAIHWNSMHQKEILEQRRLMDLRTLVSRFQVETINFSNSSHAKTLLMFILANSKYDMSVVVDALKIAQAFHFVDMRDVFSTIMENLVIDSTIGLDKVAPVLESVASLLHKHGLKDGAIKDIVRRSLAFCELTIEEEPDDLPMRLRVHTLCHGICDYLREYIPNAISKQRIFLSLSKLQSEFGILMSYSDFEAEDTRLESFEAYLLKRVGEFSYPELLRVASLLGFESPGFVGGRIALSYARSGAIEEAVKMCRALPAKESGSWKILVAVEMFLNYERGPVGSIRQLLVEGILESPAICLPLNVDLFRSACLLDEIVESCHFDDDALWDVNHHSNSFSPSQFQFRENSNVLVSETIVPLVLGFLKSLERARQCKENIDAVSVHLDLVMKYLCQNGALQLAIFCHGIADIDLIHNGSNMMQDAVVALSKKLLVAPDVDKYLGVGYLVSVADKKTSLDCFHSSLPKMHKDFHRIQTMGAIGVIFGQLANLDSLVEDCSRMYTNAGWWKTLDRFKVEFDHVPFCKSKVVSKQYFQSVLKELISKSDFDLDVCLRFAREYDITDEYAYGVHLGMLLLDSGSEITQHKVKIQILVQNCKKNILLQVCEKSWRKIDGKDYERLRIVCEILKSACDNHWDKYLLILDILQASLEMVQSNEETALDFHRLVDDPWKVLQLALTCDSVKWMVALSGPLELNPDDLYSYMVKKIITDCDAKWEDVREYLEKIHNSTRVLEAIKWMGRRMDSDAIKVISLEYAMERLPESYESRHQIEMEIKNTKTKLDLRDSFPEDECKLLMAIDKPMDLLSEMYIRYAPVASTLWQDPSRLHSLAQTIAERHGIDLSKLHQFLVLQWLDTVHEEAWSGQREETDIELRLQYVLSMSDQEKPMVAQLLAGYACQTDASMRSFRSRCRALGAMFKVCDAAMIEKAWKYPLKVLEYWQYCLYMVDVEDLRLSYTIDQLVECDKTGLVRGLWRDHKTNPRVIQMIAHFVIDLAINDFKLISAVLKQMHSLGMSTAVLSFVQSLETTFTNVGVDSTFDIRETLMDVLLKIFATLGDTKDRAVLIIVQALVTNSSFLNGNDILVLVDQFIQCECFDYAVNCSTAVVDLAIRQQCIEKMVTTKQEITLETIRTLSILKDSTCLEIAFECLDNAKLHAHLHQTEYFKDLMSFLMFHDKLTNILEVCITTDHQSEAMELCNAWVKLRGHSTDDPLNYCLEIFKG